MWRHPTYWWHTKLMIRLPMQNDRFGLTGLWEMPALRSVGAKTTKGPSLVGVPCIACFVKKTLIGKNDLISWQLNSWSSTRLSRTWTTVSVYVTNCSHWQSVPELCSVKHFLCPWGFCGWPTIALVPKVLCKSRLLHAWRKRKYFFVSFSNHFRSNLNILDFLAATVYRLWIRWIIKRNTKLKR